MSKRSWLFGIAAAMLLGGAVSSAWARPPDHAPAWGYRGHHQHHPHHRYVYYPHCEVYYAPERHVWYYRDDTASWRVSVNLPYWYEPYLVDGVTVELYNERPYADHVIVRDRYPAYRGRYRHHRDHHDDYDDD